MNNNSMQFIPIKTRAMNPPKDDLYAVLDQYLPALQEKNIVLITSKVVSIHQGRCIPVAQGISKDDLIKKEADYVLPREATPGGVAMLTIKRNTLIPSAGIDESNANGHYILWPERIQETAKEIWSYLRARNNLNDLGVIITDSHTIPLRLGVVGISIGFYGIKPLRDYRGSVDIFGRPFEMTRVNIVDALSCAAVLLMGEGAEKRPLVIARGIENVAFTREDCYDDLMIDQAEDIYAPLLNVFRKPV